MFDFRREFPPEYQQCFDDPGLLKRYLQEPEFVHHLDKMLYNSQINYFRDTPDLTAEFFLQYRDCLLRALQRFQYRDISLACYIGEMLKRYRLNFHKNKSLERKKHKKIYQDFCEELLDKASMAADWQATDEPIFVAEHDATRDFMPYRFAESILKKIQDLKRPNLSIDKKKLLLVALVLIEQKIEPKTLAKLLDFIGLKMLDYNRIVAKREDILLRLQAKKREAKRLLDHCHLNYLDQQETYYADSNPASSQELALRLEKIRQRLQALQRSYRHMKTILSHRQIGELTGLPQGEIGKYYGYLRKLLGPL